jgi:hypothetical protein
MREWQEEKNLVIGWAVCHSDSIPGFNVVIEGIVNHYEFIFSPYPYQDI